MGTKAKCRLCGEIIESKHRHDFVSCSMGHIFVDGGDEYLRCGGMKPDVNMGTDILFMHEGKWTAMNDIPSSQPIVEEEKKEIPSDLDNANILTAMKKAIDKVKHETIETCCKLVCSACEKDIPIEKKVSSNKYIYVHKSFPTAQPLSCNANEIWCHYESFFQGLQDEFFEESRDEMAGI